MQQPFYACDYSQQVGEQLYGSAPYTQTWLLLEYPRPWGAKAYEDSDIPADIKAYIDAQTQLMPHPRVQVIAKNIRSDLRDLSLYVIHAGWDTQRVRHFLLRTYADLLDLPLADIAAGGALPHLGGQAIAEPICIVCTNGKRDVCCAKHGLPLYKALTELGGEHIWQCNHIGGHRFAGTCVVFPDGVYYGRVLPEQAPLLKQAARSRTLFIPNARGRASFEPAVQAAECFLHEARPQSTPLGGYSRVDARRDGNDWEVVFVPANGAGAYRIQMTEEITSFDIINNSGEPQGKPGSHYRLKHAETLA